MIYYYTMMGRTCTKGCIGTPKMPHCILLAEPVVILPIRHRHRPSSRSSTRCRVQHSARACGLAQARAGGCTLPAVRCPLGGRRAVGRWLAVLRKSQTPAIPLKGMLALAH